MGIILLPAVERTLPMWLVLKSFFQSEEKPAKILLDTFFNPMSEIYMWFLHRLLHNSLFLTRIFID